MKSPSAWLVTAGRLFKDRAFISERGANNSAKERDDSAQVVPLYTCEPTHYAVIDEHGEIAHSVRIKSFTDAKQDCERYKGLMCNITPQAKDWTVKGVTVHC